MTRRLNLWQTIFFNSQLITYSNRGDVQLSGGIGYLPEEDVWT